MNEERIALELKPITENWKLDSIVLGSPLTFSCSPSDFRDKTEYYFLEDKNYTQYWTNKNIDITKPYLKSKHILFTKSYWIWQNRFSFEVNTYINPITDIADEVKLETTTFFDDDYPFFPAHLSYIKDGEDILYNWEFNDKMFGREIQKVDSILKQWKLR